MINNKDIYSISEVTKRTGFKPHVIRFYEKEFNLNIPRSKNNRRYFTINEIEQLLHIQKLQNEGFNNKQIKNMLQEQDIINSKLTTINDEIAITTIKSGTEEFDISKQPISNIGIDVNNELIMVLDRFNYKSEIDELNKKIENLVDRLDNMYASTNNNTDKDVLICENAKLKLKVKEKSYEIAELKERLRRYEHQNQNSSIFKKFLKLKSEH